LLEFGLSLLLVVENVGWDCICFFCIYFCIAGQDVNIKKVERKKVTCYAYHHSFTLLIPFGSFGLALMMMMMTWLAPPLTSIISTACYIYLSCRIANKKMLLMMLNKVIYILHFVNCISSKVLLHAMPCRCHEFVDRNGDNNNYSLHSSNG
jgi:hypothetical protein